MSEFSESVSPREINLGEEFKPFIGMDNKIREIGARNAVGEQMAIDSEVIIGGKEMEIQAFAPSEWDRGGGLGDYTPFPEATFRAFSARPGEPAKFTTIHYLFVKSNDPSALGLRYKITFDGVEDVIEGQLEDMGEGKLGGVEYVFNGKKSDISISTIVPPSPELLKRINFTFIES